MRSLPGSGGWIREVKKGRSSMCVLFPFHFLPTTTDHVPCDLNRTRSSLLRSHPCGREGKTSSFWTTWGISSTACATQTSAFDDQGSSAPPYRQPQIAKARLTLASFLRSMIDLLRRMVVPEFRRSLKTYDQIDELWGILLTGRGSKPDMVRPSLSFRALAPEVWADKCAPSLIRSWTRASSPSSPF